jgi:hypothetical protein
LRLQAHAVLSGLEVLLAQNRLEYRANENGPARRSVAIRSIAAFSIVSPARAGSGTYYPVADGSERVDVGLVDRILNGVMTF